MRRRRSAGAGGLIVLVLGLAAPAWAADVVFLIPGSTVKPAPGGRVTGQIQSESPTEVAVLVGASTQTIPVDQIASIRYDGQPASMNLAESRESSGALAEAADLYQKAANEAAGKPYVVQAAQAARARVLAEMAMSDPARMREAIAALQGVLKAGRNRHTPGAEERLARLALSKGDFPLAEQAINDLARVPGGSGRATLLQARLFAHRGQYAEAVGKLDGLIASAPEGSSLRREATLAKAESLAGQKKFDQAEALVQQVIKASSPEDADACASAYNTLGDCLRAAGKTKDALIAYLHTDILYSKDKEEHPRALAQIVQLFRALNRDDDAQKFLAQLKQEYPNSPYVNAAEKKGGS